MNIWTIPFDGDIYLCWEEQKHLVKHKKLSREEERIVFTSDNKERAMLGLRN